MNPKDPPLRDRPTPHAAPIVLASGSPRRRELLDLIGLRFEVHPSDIDERPHEDETPEEFASRAARDKAVDVATRHPGRCVLGADTVVEIDGVILGKPADVNGAREMLRSLSDREHLVHTGVALVVGDRVRQVVDSARVRFAELSDDVITWYVDSGEPMDKAGAYAIQGKGGLLVAEMLGSPQTVVGLPIHRLAELFAMQGLDFWGLLRTRA